MPPPATDRPLLSEARAALTTTITAWDETGAAREIAIAAERPLTLYVNKREVVTLMTLGAAPEALVIGYLRNQRLVLSLSAIASVQVDWEAEAAAVWLRKGHTWSDEVLGRRTVTTGCGQGTLFGSLVDAASRVPKPSTVALTTTALAALLEATRTYPTLYKVAGAIHGCALVAVTPDSASIRYYVEDVGRHNAVDTIAGWMWLDDCPSEGHIFYTTGRLTSEMVLKAALMGLAIIVSRSGISAMGYTLAKELGVTLIGRATGQHYLVYTHPQRLLKGTVT